MPFNLFALKNNCLYRTNPPILFHETLTDKLASFVRTGIMRHRNSVYITVAGHIICDWFVCWKYQCYVLTSAIATVCFKQMIKYLIAEAVTVKFITLLCQDVSVRNWVLTNIVETDGRFHWCLNLDAISNHLNDILSFPKFDTSFHGNSLFIGGASSPMIMWVALCFMVYLIYCWLQSVVCRLTVKRANFLYVVDIFTIHVPYEQTK